MDLVVFWVVLYKGGWFPKTFLAWSNVSRVSLRLEKVRANLQNQVSEHALNSIFAAFELFLTRTTLIPGLHVVFLIIILVLYLGLAYVTYAAQGWYTYSFLDPSSGGKAKVVAYVFGILAAILVIFGLICLLVALRKWLTEKVLGFRGKFHGGQPTDQEDLEMYTVSVK
jgi:small-conductance mechanosensitive channel